MKKIHGKVVTKIAFYDSNMKNWTYPQIKSIGDVNIRAIYPSWCRIPYIKHYTNRTFEEVETSNEIMEDYFKDKDGNYFNEDRSILIEDILHLYIY